MWGLRGARAAGRLLEQQQREQPARRLPQQEQSQQQGVARCPTLLRPAEIPHVYGHAGLLK